MPIAENFQAVHAKIRRAERIAGRPENAVELVAVTKTQDDAAIDAALATGHRLFGENKVQEALRHWQARKARDPSICVHLIGPLQTNKVKDALALFDCIETLDRDRLALALRDEQQNQGRAVSCLIQVNSGEEPQKSGIAPRELSDFLAFCRQECGLAIGGLMCIPPQDEPAGLHFALLNKLARRHGLPKLSMGMSSDFEKGIALGATSVRIGTALFGAR